MKVWELIEILQKEDPFKEVTTDMCSDLVELPEPEKRKAFFTKRRHGDREALEEFDTFAWKHKREDCPFMTKEYYKKDYDHKCETFPEPPDVIETLHFPGN